MDLKQMHMTRKRLYNYILMLWFPKPTSRMSNLYRLYSQTVKPTNKQNKIVQQCYLQNILAT